MVVVELCPLHAGCRRIRVASARNSNPPSIRRPRRNRVPTPRPTKARPVTGSQLAYNSPLPCCMPAVVVTLATVLITKVTVEGLEPSNVIGFVDGVHVVPPPGRPALQEIEIDAE